MVIDYNLVNNKIADNIETILDSFGIEYKLHKGRIVFRCPIHESDNTESMCLFTEGNTTRGNIVCWTNHCENTIGKGAINLIQYLIKQPLYKSVEFIQQFTGKNVYVDKSVQEMQKFVNLTTKHQIISGNPSIDREYITKNLDIPSTYYINRGYSPDTLIHFMIGMCTKYKSEMYMRTVVPIHNINNDYIGCMGRSINDGCPICNKYHDKYKLCPSNNLEAKWAAKWINSNGFCSGQNLYNINNAVNYIGDGRKIIIVEGAGDVWKLYESGIYNVVSIFGCELTVHQTSLLDLMGIKTIYLALDNDNAGKQGTSKIISNYSRYYNIIPVVYSGKDLGESDSINLKELLQ